MFTFQYMTIDIGFSVLVNSEDIYYIFYFIGWIPVMSHIHNVKESLTQGDFFLITLASYTVWPMAFCNNYIFFKPGPQL